MVYEDDHLTDDDVQAIAASREYFRKNPEGGVSFEQVVAECGFTMDQIVHSKKAMCNLEEHQRPKLTTFIKNG